jgi:hypothetical protein
VKKTVFLSAVLVCFIVSPCLEAGDSFLKLGKQLYTSDYDSLNNWIFAGGSDFRIIDYFSLGFEAQYAHKDLVIEGAHFFNGYLNAKFYLGDEFFRPFVGAGMGYQWGAQLNEDFLDQGFDALDQKSAFGTQFLGGIMIGKQGSLSFVAELQYKIPTGDLSDLKSVALVGGISF